MRNNIETHVLPNGLTVEYKDDTHQYFANGKEVPSITQLLDRKYGNLYSNVNAAVLKAASTYGTNVHAELDQLITMRAADPATPLSTTYTEVYNYFTHIEPLYKVKPILNERVVALYDEENNVVACGRFDMLCEAMGENYLVDFKTTSAINREHVTGQLNLYLTAAYQSGYIDSTDYKLGVIHLNGEKAKFIPITKLSPSFYLTFIK